MLAALRFAPGIGLALAVSAIAAWLASWSGLAAILLGLLIGLAVGRVLVWPSAKPGLSFAGRELLRIGIVLLGVQVTLSEVGALGVLPFIALLLVMAAAFGGGVLGARLGGQSTSVGVLAGGATAICGASASLALYGVLGRERIREGEFALTLVGVSLASALAMSFYPFLARAVGLDDGQAGFLIGASVHDVAQAIGGGFAYSDAAGTRATIVKLARVATLAPLVAMIGIVLARREERTAGAPGGWRALLPPWFISGFVALLVLGSVVPIGQDARDAVLWLSKTLLLIAVTATALNTRLGDLVAEGGRALLPVALASVASFAMALVVVLLMPMS